MVTLSLGSWSTMSKLRVVGQLLPVPSAPAVATIFAEHAGRRHDQPPLALQLERRVEEVDAVAERHLPEERSRLAVVQLPCASALGVAPTWNRSVPLNPKSMVTIASAGSFGTTGATAGVVPWVMTSGLYTDSAPGPRVQDGGLDERPQVERIDHLAAGRRGRRPVRPGELVRRGQPLRAVSG